MESGKRALWSYASHLERLGLTRFKAADLVLAFQGAGIRGVGRTVPFPNVCTHNGEKGLCRIFDYLTLLNELLWFTMAELREVQPGRLGFTCLHLHRCVPEDSTDQLEYTYALIHSVLANHRCVVSVVADYEMFQLYPTLFSDALRQCTSLERLHISTSGWDFNEVGKLIVDVCTNCRLKEFTCSEIRLLGSGGEVQARFADFLKTSTTLKVLSISNTTCCSNYEIVMGPLQANSTITVLRIDSACIELDNGTALSKFLSANSVLMDLTLVKQSWHAPCSVGILFKCLETNRVLQRLTLQRFSFTLTDAIAMSEALTVNTTLQELDISSIEYKCMQPWLSRDSENGPAVDSAKCKWGEWWRVQPFVDTLRNSVSLQRLRLGHIYFHNHELQSLLEAVKERDSFRQIHILQLSCGCFCDFVNIVEETGTFDKVVIRHCYSNAALFADTLRKCQRLPVTGSHSFRYLDIAHLKEICTALRVHDNVTSINLQTDPRIREAFDKQCAELLAQYISSTTALKELDITLNVSDKSVNSIVMAGLLANTSLQKLTIYSCSLYDSDVCLFTRWIQQSKTLYSLLASCTPDSVRSRFMSELANCLQHSYTLTSVTILNSERSYAHWQVIQGQLSRNASLVLRATHFAMGSKLKMCATAFELVHWHPEVFRRLLQGKDQGDEVRQKLAVSKKRLLTDFWQLAGVVKEDLCCHKRDDGKLQIDELGFDAWMTLRKYLKVGDVADAQRTTHSYE